MARAQDAALQTTRSAQRFLSIHAAVQHLQRPAPSHRPPHAQGPPRRSVPDVASRHRDVSQYWDFQLRAAKFSSRESAFSRPKACDLPDEPRRRWRAIAQHRAAGSLEPRGQRQSGAISAGPLRRATRSCRSRITTTRKSNGDVGYIDDVAREAGEVKASFDGRSMTYGFGELDTLVPAYAAAIHKSQGSELSRRDHPCPHPALRNVAAKSPLHRRYAWQEALWLSSARKGHRDCGSQRNWPATLIKTRHTKVCVRAA